MIGFWIVAALLVAAVLAILLRPLVRQAAAPAEEGEPVTLLFRRQLAELEADLAQGRIAAGEAAAMRTEITRRMLAEADRRPGRPAPASGGAREGDEKGDRTWRFAIAAGLAGLLPAAALAVYYTIGAPAAVTGLAAADPHGAADLAAAVTRLKAHVAAAPGDRDGWIMLGRSLVALGRFEEAQDAFRRAIALDPQRPELHAELGEVLVLAAQGMVTPAAMAQFAQAPHDPRARFYEAEAAAQHGDLAGAKRALAALLADAPADAPWRRIVAAGLAALAKAEPQPAAGSAAGSAPAAAPAPDPSGMVAKLAEQLKRHPDDAAGWMMLARSYRVLGRTADAISALKQANQDIPGNLPLLKQYLAAIAAGMSDGRPGPELVDVALRIHALDAQQPDALWYLGLAAAGRGDRFAAAQYWTQLVSELPAGSSERAAVQQKLDSLR